MADNLNIDAGSTLTVATDDISGVHYQRVKIAQGADGAAVDVSPAAPLNVTVASATLGTVTITGTVTPSTTASTITNAVGNPVNVSLTSTEVTVKSAVAGFNVNVATATLGTVTISGNVNVATATLGTVTITGTTVITSGNINVATATLGTVTVTGTVNPTTTNVTVNIGRTLTGSSGSFTATNATLFTPTNRAKVYAFSLTTTSASELICVFHSGGLELWRDTLMAPAGASAGANLAVAPPAFLFASRTGTAVSLSISSAVLIHWSLSLFDEA